MGRMSAKRKSHIYIGMQRQHFDVSMNNIPPPPTKTHTHTHTQIGYLHFSFYTLEQSPEYSIHENDR